MKPFSLSVIVSCLVPGLALMLVLGVIPFRLGRKFAARKPAIVAPHSEAEFSGFKPCGAKCCAGLALLAFGLVMFPVDGLPLARWLAGIVDHWSIPFLALLASSVAHQFLGVEILRRQDRQAAWLFGAVAGVVLYPLALGWGPLDPFSLGWNSGPLFVGMAALTVALLWNGNRFGVVLVLAIIAWYLDVPESGNYWDCLVDPFYFVASLGALAWHLFSARRAAGSEG